MALTVGGMFPGKDEQMITRADHFSHTVSSLDESLHFFCDQLGLERPEVVEFEGELVESILGIPELHLRVAYVPIPGGGSLELIEYVNPKGKEIDLTTSNPGVSHVCFVVDGLDALYQDLKSQGVTLVNPPNWTQGADGHGNPGLWTSVFAKGPDGISVELYELIPDKA